MIFKMVYSRPYPNIPAFSPRRQLYPPACKPYGLEAEPEASIPSFLPRETFSYFTGAMEVA